MCPFTGLADEACTLVADADVTLLPSEAARFGLGRLV
jgi:hypothetical protein